MVKLPSAGKLNLAVKCLGSVLLPRVREEAGPEAERGKYLHAKLEKYFKAGRQIPEEFDATDRELVRRVEGTIGVRPANESSEVGLAVASDCGMAVEYVPSHENADGKFGSSRVDRVYADRTRNVDVVPAGGSDAGGLRVGDYGSERSEWYVAIADLVQQRSESSFVVWDWKSSTYVPDPEYNWQLLLPAIWLYISSGRPSDFRCDLGAVYITSPDGDGAFKRTADYHVDSATCERRISDLLRLSSRLANASASEVTLYEGKHCSYCPARHRCPAKVGAFYNSILNASGKDVGDVGVVSASRTLVDNMPQLKKMEINILLEHGGELDLCDGRIAVLKKAANNKYKVFTKRAKEQSRSDVEEASEPGTESN